MAEALPFPENRFDFVLMVTTVCFVDDVSKALEETLRVLKSGGCIIVGFIDRDSALGKRYAEKKDSSKFYQEATFLSAPALLRYFKETGFVVTSILQTFIPGELPQTIMEGFGQGVVVVVKGVQVNAGNKTQ